jgi:hypothetical protein
MSASGCAKRQHHGNRPASRLCGAMDLEANVHWDVETEST